MKTAKLREHLLGLFDRSKLSNFPEEHGFSIYNENVSKIGYCTNLTPQAIEEALKNEVDFILTHHDSWSFIYGMKEKCLQELEKNRISHAFFHLLLDDCEFGTNVAFLNKLGAKVVEKTSLEDGAFYCGRIGEFDTPVEFSSLVNKIESILEEPVKAWKNNEKLIKRIGFLSGAGFGTTDMKEFHEKGCDVYITGEKILYTIEYAEFVKMNLIIGSHTFTEIFGVESMAQKISEADRNIEIIRLNEKHNE